MNVRVVDDAVARVERALILACVAGMTVLVGADVAQRTFSRPIGKCAELLAWIGATSAPNATAGDALFEAVAVAIFVAAAHAARQVKAERQKAPSPRLLGSAALGLAIAAAVFGAVHALLWAFPSSVPGAQKFALGLMLWAGMLGASQATRERRHIVLDLVTKKLDADAVKPFALLSGLTAAIFCAFVAYLGAVQLAGEVHEWATHDNVGVYESLPIPTWISTLSIPASFALMAARFAVYAVRDFREGPPKLTSEGVDLDALERGVATE